MIEKLEDSLNGGYAGLYGEIVTEDVYRIKDLPFVPQKIWDFGANVGIFTRMCLELFPRAYVFAFEPNKENAEILFKFTNGKFMVSVAAIGKGQFYHGLAAANGSGETYLNAGIGYPDMDNDTSVEKVDIKSFMPFDVISEHILYGGTTLVKIDIEGNEKEIFTHEPSMEILRKCDYICMEVHFYSQTGGEVRDELIEKTMQALKSFEDTHYIELDNVHFWAIKKKWGRLPEQTITSRAQLVTLLKRLRLPLNGAELGVAEGLFSADLLRSGMEKLIMVDNWGTLNQVGDAGFPQKWHDKNYRDAIARVSEFGGKATILRGLTAKMASHVADESLGLVYLDAGHDYTNVMGDINAWYPKLVKGGIMALHDYNMSYKGLMDAVHEFTDNNGLKRYPLPEKAEKDRGVYFIKP